MTVNVNFAQQTCRRMMNLVYPMLEGKGSPFRPSDGSPHWQHCGDLFTKWGVIQERTVETWTHVVLLMLFLTFFFPKFQRVPQAYPNEPGVCPSWNTQAEPGHPWRE